MISFLLCFLCSGTALQVNSLGQLTKLEGVWSGTCSGRPGIGTVTKTFTSFYGGKFVKCETVLTIPAKGGKPANVHQDLTIFSYDVMNQTLRMRQFHNEGFVHTCELQSSGLGHWVFEGKDVENLPPGFRPRLTIDLHSDGTLNEVFSLAQPGKDFSEYVRTIVKRLQSATSHRR